MFDGLNELLLFLKHPIVFLFNAYFSAFQILFKLHSNVKELRENIAPKTQQKCVIEEQNQYSSGDYIYYCIFVTENFLSPRT